MKLPFSFHVSGSAVASFDHDVEIDDDNQENIGNDTAEAIFADYLWMEHEEEFDKIEMLRLDEEALVQNCLEDNREDDDADESIVIDSESVHWTEAQAESLLNGEYSNAVEFSEVEVNPHDVANSNLNPLAEEFYPSSLTSGGLK